MIKKYIKKVPFIEKIAIYIYNNFRKIYMFMCNKIYGVKENTVIFTSFSGKTYSDNPRAISEKLHGLHPKSNIIWIFNEPGKKKGIVPEYVICTKSNTLKALKAYATSKVWVDNFSKPIYMYKSKAQYYIQTWHGDRAFKKILYDSTFISKDFKLIENKICGTIITGSRFAEVMYKSAFKYEGEFLKTGCPRNDVLINSNQERKRTIKASLNLKFDNKIVLYAPTLRRKASYEKGNQKTGDLDLLEVLNKLNKKTEHKWLCLIRAHSAVAGLEGIPDDDRIIDVTSYEDMADLLQITDLLITDYSSSATDFILTKNPVILYQSDYLEYLKFDRTFYYDIEKTGFLIAYTQKELNGCIDIILNEDAVVRNRKTQEFYGVYENGTASKDVAEYIISLVRQGER